jgi:hypothetical protein
MVSTNWKVKIKLSFLIFFNFNYDLFRAFVYLTNLLYGLPLVQNVAIVSERGEIKGYLKIALQQLQTNDITNEQIKLMKTYKNASGMTKIVFDDETYFQVCLKFNFRKMKITTFWGFILEYYKSIIIGFIRSKSSLY